MARRWARAAFATCAVSGQGGQAWGHEGGCGLGAWEVGGGVGVGVWSGAP